MRNNSWQYMLVWTKVHVQLIETNGEIYGILTARPVAGAALSKELLAKIKRSTTSLGSLLALSRRIRSCDNLVSEISALHLELADQKISDRARGLLEDQESVEAITAHVN